MAQNKSANKKKKNPTASDSASALHSQLARVEGEILKSINQRAELARRAEELTSRTSLPANDPHRDDDTIQRAVTSNPGPLGDDSVRAVFRELVSGTRALLAPTCVAYLGPEFTFSHLAALEQFGEGLQLIPVASIRSVFEEVERDQAEFGVVPMENSTDGRVSDTLECFSHSKLRICGEVPLKIHHCLMGKGGQDEIEVVHSKPQALSQCRHWLAQHLPAASQRPVASTADAALHAQSDSSMAAIGSQRAAAHYDLKVFARNIEDSSHNITRFAMIARQAGPRTGNDKTALLVEIAHEPGALADTMAVFKRNRLNMTWIESFPIPDSPGRYLFFIEFLGHQKDLRCRKAIEAVEKKSLRLEVLGSYAQMEPIG